ncbi:MAG: SH3 domain-containing protein [Turneriella sp.]
MKYTRTRYYLLLSLILTTAAAAQETGEMLSVAVKPGAMMRGEGSVTGKPLGNIPFGASVRVVGAPDAPTEVMNITGTWLQVEYNGKTGWVFGPLLKRPGQKHTVRIMNGTIVIDDPTAQVSGEVAQLIALSRAGSIALEIQSSSDSMRQCSGTLILLNAGKLRNDNNSFNCGGTSSESHYQVLEWHLISGRIFFTALKKGNEICHSEKCSETPRSEKITREFRHIKAAGQGKFMAEF